MTAEIEARLARIAALAAKTRDPHELDNLLRDLGLLETRLAAGEYRQTDFEARSALDVPRRTREFFSYMESYHRHAQRWAQILGAIPLDLEGEVMDLCPGWAPKVEIALVRLGFTGRLVLLDRDRAAAEALRGFVQLFGPRFVFELREHELFTAPAAPSPLVIANHILDDLLVGQGAAELGLDEAQVYGEEAALREVWGGLLGRRDELLRDWPDRLFDALSRQVAAGGCLVLTHYRSFVERALDLGQVTSLCGALFDEVCGRFLDNGFQQLTAPSVTAPGEELRCNLLRSP